ncbi:MAG TPA: YdcF family protein [Anaerolineae bacterium]|nr:YdcF family protein [Anaerolineae bacterium]
MAVGITFTLRIDHFLILDEAPVSADAIVVLASAPSRIRHAVSLFKQGYAPVVVFTDATYHNTQLACSSAPLDTEAAQDLGLPSHAMVITQKQVTSTYDEAVAVRDLVQERHWQSLLVVTDPFHTRRANHTFRELLPDVSITTSAAPDAEYEPQHWWQSEEGVTAVFSEIIKMIFYWSVYGIAP